MADGTPAALTARSRYHNAVTLTLETGLADVARAHLSTLAGVASMEEVVRGGDHSFTMFSSAKGEADTGLIDRVAQLAKAEGWNVRSLYGEPGRLDEVFRSLTRSDTAENVQAGEDAA